ncbi:lysine N(6)-hydroxylase/L-ornithine N(5)-oxygenase family protein [Chryseobacterium sp. ERMR1:04]|uniref:lysine N(6)-hydroxylase/L-ornithine N(5)-oxygenase family protein n=1 Tax=Chryseobacterium sp. ERMR1:04 TaxID=1705393 RepID=UPI0006C889BD|nr:SidA/IucD/PvdA family monooxygenase [Chryseobacterium sp. ERMR1:04]KPH14355.1 alcaligin biosynthesis protein [Chryseobacterium sp. ERMR1:04]
MENNKIYDIIGIGIGPFNLGLAALLEPVESIDSLFLDQAEGFDWHPGLMLDNATLQVPFMADLVTMADPKSKYSFLNFLKETDRLYKFYIREDFFILRKEYNLYCQWAANQLPNCLFGKKVENISFEESQQIYTVEVLDLKNNDVKKYYTKKLALGTGTQPRLPEFMEGKNYPNVIHTSEYLKHKDHILNAKSVSIIGSGQSAAEIFQDLLPETNENLHMSWFTRPDRFFPMEYSKLTLELTSPEYVDHFYNMPPSQRQNVLAKQPPLYKGINFELINDIFDTLYEMSVGNVPLHVDLKPSCQLDNISPEGNSYVLNFTHIQDDITFTNISDYVILATGYKYKEPKFLQGIKNQIQRNEEGLFDVSREYTIDSAENIFVQNAELHTHGFVTPDLGMGAYRNAIIINAIAGKEIYTVEKRIAFQQFNTTKAWTAKHSS